MSISISDTRIAQVTQTVNTFIDNFNQPLTSDLTPEQFKAVLHADIQWTDHGFHVRRIGADAIWGLRNSFLHCNQPFRAEMKAVTPTSDGAVLEQVWIGRCANDIVRPDGQVAMKASGKDFKCHVCMAMKISADGLIERISEYYDKRWDDGVSEDIYAVIGA